MGATSPRDQGDEQRRDRDIGRSAKSQRATHLRRPRLLMTEGSLRLAAVAPTCTNATTPAPTIIPCGIYALLRSPPGTTAANSGLSNSSFGLPRSRPTPNIVNAQIFPMKATPKADIGIPAGPFPAMPSRTPMPRMPALRRPRRRADRPRPRQSAAPSAVKCQNRTTDTACSRRPASPGTRRATAAERGRRDPGRRGCRSAGIRLFPAPNVAAEMALCARFLHMDRAVAGERCQRHARQRHAGQRAISEVFAVMPSMTISCSTPR